MNIKRKSYPSDVSDEEWSFCVSYLTLMDEAAPQREVMTPLDHVDGVDLEPPHVLHEGDERAGGEGPRPRPDEVLAGQEQPGDGPAREGRRAHGGSVVSS